MNEVLLSFATKSRTLPDRLLVRKLSLQMAKHIHALLTKLSFLTKPIPWLKMPKALLDVSWRRTLVSLGSVSFVTTWQGEYSLQNKSSQDLIRSRIIEPLASRCSKFRFTPLDSTSASTRLTHIAKEEKVDVGQPVIDALINTSNGDLRRAITYLQSAARLSAASEPPTPILPIDIQEIAGVVPNTVITDLARTLGIDMDEGMDVDGTQTSKTGGFEPIKKKIKYLMREGYSASQIILQVGFLLPLFLKKKAQYLFSCMTWLFFILPSQEDRSLPLH